MGMPIADKQFLPSPADAAKSRARTDRQGAPASLATFSLGDYAHSEGDGGAPDLFLPAAAGTSASSSTLPITMAGTDNTLLGEPEQFIIAPSIPAIPGKLVRRIQALEFVDMKDLLPDNIALLEQLEALSGSTQSPNQLGPARTPRRKVNSITTWASCFATYVVILAQRHPQQVPDLLGYMRLVLREARRHGRQG